MSSYSGKRLCDMMDDGLDDLLSQAVDRCEEEEVDLDDGLDGILSQSLDIFEQKSLDDDAIGITDMFESGGPSLVMARRFRTAKGNPFEERCVVRIIKTDIERCPKESLVNAFYLKPLQKYENRDIWFSTIPLGHNKLNSMVKTMMSEAGVKEYFTNHSLRATTVSKLSREGVDDKLIRGVTGHRSEALQSYKQETDEQLVRVSKIVQGQSSENTRHQENFAAVQIPTHSGAITLNVSGGNCNITINKN